MLFDVPAYSASATLNGVAEAFGVHEIGQQVSADVAPLVNSVPLATVVSAAAVPPSSVRAANPVPDAPPSGLTLGARVDPAMLPKLSGTTLLQQLVLQPGSDIAAFVSKNPKSVKALLAAPPRAVAVAGMWARMDPSEQSRLMGAAPELVGNLEGIPYSVRDAANRLYLKQQIALTRARIAVGAGGRAQNGQAQHHLEVLRQVQRALVTGKGQPVHQLLSLDPRGEVRAAVVVGDLDTADYVSYMVPGMFFTVQGQMYDWTVIAQDLYTQQVGWVSRLGKTDAAMRGKTVATVAWIGYTTPDVLDIASLDQADEGAQLLGQTIDGVQAARTGHEPYVTLITHSYGSTAAMIELAKGGVEVDALAIVGSPGSAAQTAKALDVKQHNVYVGEAAWDPVVNTAFYGSDPGASSFGARDMSVAGGIDPITHKLLGAAVGHLGYFDPGSEAMRNFALIGLGRGDLVTMAATHAPKVSNALK